MFNLFKKMTADQVMRDQLAEAKLAAAQHEAAAEHHEALAMMYASRVERLERALAPAANDSVSPS